MLRLLQVTDTLVEQGEDLIEQGKETVNSVVEQGREIFEAAKADPALLAVLIGVGVITAGIFFWGVVKQVFKAAVVAGLLSAGVWFWYFNIR